MDAWTTEKLLSNKECNFFSEPLVWASQYSVRERKSVLELTSRTMLLPLKADPLLLQMKEEGENRKRNKGPVNRPEGRERLLPRLLAVFVQVTYMIVADRSQTGMNIQHWTARKGGGSPGKQHQISLSQSNFTGINWYTRLSATTGCIGKFQLTELAEWLKETFLSSRS